ncbi:hypothetical protein MHO82_21040 [Vibrio sp. Of7-15]|uniref:hypothetical protein n=1 Tax=Vibrio sp. Of7-15 TaxID=2724879 RepID=UPI001EF314F4|nr:hypothetical protein [Vibrio sp. Of7-15]MCG7499355.1 hypothetical protein [Vibrio sp. Of7-15]
MEPVTQVECTVVIPYSYLNLIVPFATIIAAIIGGWWVAKINKANSIRTAKYDFLSSVLVCFEGVYPARAGSNQEIFTVLRSAYPKLNVAVHRFRFYVPASSITSYDDSWNEYEQWYQNNNEQSITVHAFYGEGASPYKKLCEHIKTLLNHAT